MPPQANQPLPEGHLLENYRILRVLAQGGFSIVYLAHDENETPVAIKEYLPSTLALRTGADGVHLTSTQLMQSQRRPEAGLIGVSCHDAGELARAQALGADFAVLGPVQPTPSHPGAAGMGWDRFAALLGNCTLPVYALGGLRADDLDAAQRRGAHGISMMRAIWE